MGQDEKKGLNCKKLPPEPRNEKNVQGSSFGMYIHPERWPVLAEISPLNGWNCRCTTIEIWEGESAARIDFGITGRDPRKRTPEELNVPPEFQGNVGILTYGPTKKEPEKPKKQETIQIPVKQSVSKESVPPPNESLRPEIDPVFQSPVKRFWYEVLKYVQEMYVLPDPKKIIKITLTPKGIEF